MQNQTVRRWRSIGLVCCALSPFALTACTCKSLASAQAQSPIPNPLELDAKGDGWTEISAGVVPVISVSGDGKFFVFGNSNGLARGLHTAGPGPFDIPLPSAPNIGGYWSNDQQTIQLANGDMLLSWNGYSNTFDEQFKSSEWWNKWPTADGNAPGGVGYPVERGGIRPAELLWRYSAQDDKWSTTVNKLDAALVGALDANGKVQRSYCAQGVPWVVGFDRPELYADPWGVDKTDPTKQRLVLSVRCQRSDDDSRQIFVSNDSGAVWQDSGIRLGGGMASVTATSSGRLFILQGTTLYFSDDHGNSIAPASASGFDVTDPGHPLAALQGTDTGVGPPFVAPTPIAAVGPSTVLAVYPSVEIVTVNGISISRQVAVVVLALVPLKEDPTPIIFVLKVIRAKAADGSVILPMFITDDRPLGNPASMLYWLETTSKPATPGTDPVTLVARYVMFAGTGAFPTEAKDLSTAQASRRRLSIPTASATT
jgi:hypothetical protein